MICGNERRTDMENFANVIHLESAERFQRLKPHTALQNFEPRSLKQQMTSELKYKLDDNINKTLTIRVK